MSLHISIHVISTIGFFNECTMACSPVGLISFMDRASMQRSGFDFLSSLNFCRFFFNRLSCLFNCEDHYFHSLFGLPSVNLLKLQRLQNAAARLISNVPRYSHVTPVLCSLHWLPVKFRIDFKILLFTFKAIYGHAPGYLIDLIAIKEQPRYNLRSASGLILKYPSLKLKKTFGDRAFSSAACYIVIYGTICPFTSVLRTVLNVLNLYLKRMFLD